LRSEAVAPAQSCLFPRPIERERAQLDDQLNARARLAAARRRPTTTHRHPPCAGALKQRWPANQPAGSLVDFDRCGFDFHCPRRSGPGAPRSLEQIEDLIKLAGSSAHGDEVQESAERQARAAGGRCPMFERNTTDEAGVDVPGVLVDRTLGSTHVWPTPRDRSFKIYRQNQRRAAAFRRIEAVAGPPACLTQRPASSGARPGGAFQGPAGEIAGGG